MNFDKKYLKIKKQLAAMTTEQKWKLVEESFGMWAELKTHDNNNWSWVMVEGT